MNTESPAVSVIVPVYKAEKYLRKCVDSILAQTFRDFEVLLVDDGSPDGSGAICDEYARKDPRVRVFHKENGGVSSARQCGLDNARGEYTIHADPDDWVEPNMLEELYTKAKAEDADMVICDFYVNDRRGQRYVRQQPSALDHETVLRELFQQLHGSCCNKLVRRACYSRYGVRFPLDISFCEDVYVNAALLKHAVKVVYHPKAFYHYVNGNNPNSLVRSYTQTTYNHDIRLLNHLDKLTQGMSCHDLCFAHFSVMSMSRAFDAGIYTGKEFVTHFSDYRSSIWRDSSPSLIRRISLWLSCSGLYRPMLKLYLLKKRIR